MLSTTKNKAVVGLDVEAGSIAATEVASTATRRSRKFGIAPLGAGVFREGEVVRPRGARRRAQGAVLRAQALEDRPGRARQPAGRGADAAPAADRGPRRARDGDPLPGPGPHPDAARAGGARLAGGRPCDRRERRAPGRRGRGGRAARHARRADAGAEPRRPAAGRDRPLGVRDDPRARRRVASPGRAGRLRRCPGSGPPSYEERIAGQLEERGRRRPTPAPEGMPGEALLQPRRRHQPRGGPRRDLPVHPRLAVRGRGDRPEARRAASAHPRARPPVARPRGPRAAARGDRGRRARRSPPRARRSPRAPRGWSTSFASRSSTTPPRRARCRSRASSPAAPGPRSPGSPSASSATSASGSRSAGRALWPTSTRPTAARLTALLRPRPGGVARAPRQPDPARGAPWREGADAHRRPRLRDRRGARRRPGRRSRASCSRATRSPTARPRRPSLEARSRRREAEAERAAAPSPTSPPCSRPGSRRSRASPGAASTGSASCASWRS